jgi:hypothetical protein
VFSNSVLVQFTLLHVMYVLSLTSKNKIMLRRVPTERVKYLVAVL